MEKKKKNAGFSIIELTLAMTTMLVLLGLVTTLFSKSMHTKKRESRRTDALTSSQAALNVISRELANAGYGLTNNGLVAADSDKQRIHFRANINNNGDSGTTSPGEDITYFYDSATKSIVRYDPHDNPKTSVVVNKISEVNFRYWSYTGSNSTPTLTTTPTKDTGRVEITVMVELEDVPEQPKQQKVKLTSDVTLRNSTYMLNQY